MVWKFNLSSSAAVSFNKTAGSSSLPRPTGYISNEDRSLEADVAETAISAEAELKNKMNQVMAVAYSPAKQLLSTTFMLWMSGTSIQIFSIMTTGMALINPLKGIASIEQTFSKFENIDTKIAKLAFVGFQLLAFGVALYNCSRMGLLPATSADWLSYLPDREYLEILGKDII